jgi:hypothetical protein
MPERRGDHDDDDEVTFELSGETGGEQVGRFNLMNDAK